eukprot:m.264741 g.264741  ORF g.264741 m.264741 type:complete len:586 (+) comp22777_c0_seq1:129-1886(+)
MVMDSTDQLESDSDCELESDSLLLPDVDPDRDLPLLELPSGRGAPGDRIPGPDPRKQRLFNFHPPACLHLRWRLVICWFLLELSFIGTNLININKSPFSITLEQAAARGASQMVLDSTRIRIVLISAVRFCAALALATWIVLRFNRNQLLKSCFGPNAALSPGRNWSSPWEVHREFRDVFTMPYSLTSWHIIGCVLCIVLQPLTSLLPYWEVNDFLMFITFHNNLIQLVYFLVVGLSIFTFVPMRVPSKQYLRESRAFLREYENVLPGVEEQYFGMKRAADDRIWRKFSHSRKGNGSNSYCGRVLILLLIATLSVLTSMLVLSVFCFWSSYWDGVDSIKTIQFIQYNSCEDMLRHNAAYASIVLTVMSIAWFFLFVGPIWAVYATWDTPIVLSEVMSERQTELLCELLECISTNSEATADAAQKLVRWTAARHLLQRIVMALAVDAGNHLVSLFGFASAVPIVAFLRYSILFHEVMDAQWWFMCALALTPLPIALVVWRRALKLCKETTKQIGRFEHAILYSRYRPQENKYIVETLQAALDTLKAQDIKPRIFWISVSPWAAGSLVGVPSLITGVYALVQRFKHD